MDQCLAAWAWEPHHAIDYFETDSGIDSQRVVVHGHSRLGWATPTQATTISGEAIIDESGKSASIYGGNNLGIENINDTLRSLNGIIVNIANNERLTSAASFQVAIGGGIAAATSAQPQVCHQY